MDGLGQAVGDGITSLVGGAIDAIGRSLAGIVDALGRALPAGSLPVLGVAAAVLVLVALVRR